MSAFAALGGFDGDQEDIQEEMQKRRVQQEAEERAAAEAAARAFQDFKAKAGQTNWADDDDDEDETFFSRPVCTRLPRRIACTRLVQ